MEENQTPTPDEPGITPEPAPIGEPGPSPEPVVAPGPAPVPEPVAPPAPPAPPAPEPVAAPPAPPAPPQYAPPAGTTTGPVGGAAEKNKLVAGILGILLGGLGIHKFYLGYTKEGVIMLLGNLLWVVGLGWVPNVVGVIEGVIYLVKTDQDFYATYVAGSKPWF